MQCAERRYIFLFLHGCGCACLWDFWKSDFLRKAISFQFAKFVRSEASDLKVFSNISFKHSTQLSLSLFFSKSFRNMTPPPLPFFPCKSPNMFHTVSLNEVDSGNAVTLLCLPSFQSEVWPAALVVLWPGADWAAGAAEAVRLSRVGFLPLLLRSRGVHVPDFGFVVFLLAEEPHEGLSNDCLCGPRMLCLPVQALSLNTYHAKLQFPIVNYFQFNHFIHTNQ